MWLQSIACRTDRILLCLIKIMHGWQALRHAAKQMFGEFLGPREAMAAPAMRLLTAAAPTRSFIRRVFNADPRRCPPGALSRLVPLASAGSGRQRLILRFSAGRCSLFAVKFPVLVPVTELQAGLCLLPCAGDAPGVRLGLSRPARASAALGSAARWQGQI